MPSRPSAPPPVAFALATWALANLCLTPSLLGCVGDLRAGRDCCVVETARDGGTDGGAPPSAFTSEATPDGTTVTVADARSSLRWVSFDLDSGAEAETTGEAWDLGFRRFVVRVNGGASGSGGVRVAPIESGDFYGIDTVPSDAQWITDAPDSPEDEDEDPETAITDLARWFDYDPATHGVSPKPDLFYLVQSTEGMIYKFRMLGFYDEHGTSGFVRFEWALLDTP